MTTSGWGPPQDKATTTLLLRHGQTAMSAERRFAGRGDIPLTDLGREQAAAAAARLKARGGIDLIASSPLSRARHTAEAVAEATGAPLVTDEDLAETDFGDWEGLTFAEVMARWPDEMAAWRGSADVAPPGGESLSSAARRALAALDRLLAVARAVDDRDRQPRHSDQDHHLPRSACASGGAVPDTPRRRLAIRGGLVRRWPGAAAVDERHCSSACRRRGSRRLAWAPARAPGSVVSACGAAGGPISGSLGPMCSGKDSPGV